MVSWQGSAYLNCRGPCDIVIEVLGTSQCSCSMLDLSDLSGQLSRQETWHAWVSLLHTLEFSLPGQERRQCDEETQVSSKRLHIAVFQRPGHIK